MRSPCLSAYQYLISQQQYANAHRASCAAAAAPVSARLLTRYRHIGNINSAIARSRASCSHRGNVA